MPEMPRVRTYAISVVVGVGALATTLTSGTASAVPATPPSQPYVVNGGFESPSVPAGQLAGRTQIKGWQATGQKLVIVNGTYGPAEEGSQYVLLTAGKSTGLSQTARLDKTYRHILSFSYAAQPGSNADSKLLVTINGTPVKTYTDNSWADEPGYLLWNNGTLDIPTTSDHMVTVAFQNTGATGDPGMLLDNIIIYALDGGGF